MDRWDVFIEDGEGEKPKILFGHYCHDAFKFVVQQNNEQFMLLILVFPFINLFPRMMQ